MPIKIAGLSIKRYIYRSVRNTPLFPAWRGQWRPPPSRRVTAAYTSLVHCTLARLETRFGAIFDGIAALRADRASARERPYSIRRTFWGLLWQMTGGHCSCQAVVQQFQALLALAARPAISDRTGGYCSARARLPLAVLTSALSASAAVADHRAATLTTALRGRPLKLLDGTTLTLPDTPKNRKDYPQPSSQKPGCGFPLLHLLVVGSGTSGAVLQYAEGDHHHGEMRLLHQLLPTLNPKDIVVYDRAAGNFVAATLLHTHRVDLISRVSGRAVDWRRGRRLGRHERRVTWRKGRQRPPYLDEKLWTALPDEIDLRLVRVAVKQRGFRTRVLCLMTTLLDPAAYPAAEIAAAYLRRWRLEMCLDDLKTTLGLDALRAQTPATVRSELLGMLITHNLVRVTMAEVARAHAVPLERLSFTATLHALTTFSAAAAQASRPAQIRRIWAQMLHSLAASLVPWRPDRWEPRARKRRPKNYPWLTSPRPHFRDRRHGTYFRRPKKT
jgi:hypothetical protein